MPGFFTDDFDDDRLVGLIKVALTRAWRPGPTLAAELL